MADQRLKVVRYAQFSQNAAHCTFTISQGSHFSGDTKFHVFSR